MPGHDTGHPSSSSARTPGGSPLQEKAKGVRKKVNSNTFFKNTIVCAVSLAAGKEVVVAVQSLSRVCLFVTPGTAVCQDSLSFTISQSLLKHVSIELMMSFNHLIPCHLLLLLPLIFPSISLFGSLHQVAKVLELQHQSFQ